MKLFRTIKILLKSLYLLMQTDNINVWKTIKYNFVLLPFNQAIYLPLFLYGKITIQHDGGIFILSSNRLTRGLIKIGTLSARYMWWGTRSDVRTVITLNGKWIANGSFILCAGCLVRIERDAVFETYEDSIIAFNAKIVCSKAIKIGKSARFSWDVQIFDTNFHYSVCDGKVAYNRKAIAIGNYCWIGNRVSIMKGTNLPNHSVVASNSLVNKDFSRFGECCLISGIPAKAKPINIKRIFADFQLEEEINEYFERTGQCLVDVTEPEFYALYTRRIDIEE